MKKSTVSDRMAKAENRYGKTLGASKGKAPLPKAKVSARPTGGLKPDGVKIKWKKEF